MPGEVLLIDNVDSFTYNVADLLHRVLGQAPVLWSHDHPATAADLRRFAAIVVGPGPGRPQVAADMGLSDLALRQREVPVLGVCLGHQGLAHVAGERVAEMTLTRHGIVSEVEHEGTGIFAGVPSPLRVVRYHSLEVVEPLRSTLVVTARSRDDGCVMALADPERPFWGVQFHPESVLSEHGELIVANFLRLAGVGASGHHSPPDDDLGTVAVGDALAPAFPEAATAGRADRRRVWRRCRRLEVPGLSALDPMTLHGVLVGDAPTSIWLDASDDRGWSLLVDSRGPLATELSHHVGQEEAPLLDRIDAVLGEWELAPPKTTGPDLSVADGPVDADPPRDDEDVDPPPTWCPGIVGYWGYELKAETGGEAAYRSPWPDGWFILADRGVVLDHDRDAVWAVWLEDEDDAVVREQRTWVDRLATDIVAAAGDPTPARQEPRPTASPRPTPTATPRHDEATYLGLVRRAQAEIARGESYEICLTTTVAARDTVIGEEALYRALREVSPVPHGAWLRSPAVSVLSGSPERFVAVQHGVVEARPIKGTRPRGRTADEDVALAADLATATKDRAENLMIVDLLRNDLHRVCRSGSVHVPEIFAVETYATVHQLVSTVRGTLAEGMGPTDVLRACFPGGSMTGAPKVRTMEILDQLEGAARGIYSGAIGWIGLDGAMDTSIVIRTLTWSGGDVTFGVGGAVTALSDPDEEYAETRAKASSMLRAMAVASGQSG